MAEPEVKKKNGGIVGFVKDLFSKKDENPPDADGRIWVSHYTTKEKAEKIMEEGLLRRGNGETYICVMFEPSTPEEAEDAGAMDTEAKILFKAHPDLELHGDRGASDLKLPNAGNFQYPGSVQLKNRSARVEYPERKQSLLDKIKGFFKRKDNCEGR